jgi:cytochrome P450
MTTEIRCHKISQLPGPKGLPILGNLLQIELPKLHLIMEQWADLYGDVYKFKLANKTVVAISNTELIQTILRDRPKTYRRISSIENVARELQVNGLLTSEGEYWRRQRYITMQGFKSDCLRRFFPTMRQITNRLFTRWSKDAVAGQSTDVKSDWMRFTVDITTNFAFGYDINLLEKESDSFQQHLENQLPGFNRRVNAPFPYWHFVKLPSDRALEKSLTEIKEVISEFISLARQRLEHEPELVDQPSNFLEALLLSQDEDGTHFSDEEIQGNIYNILMAGEDTTAHTLSWLFYFLSEHPEVQHKMQQEADAVLGKDTLPQDMGVIDKLAYIEAAAHETLRLKGAAPLLFLETNIDVELDGLMIPKATPIMLVNRHGALQEKNFSDALQFKPERWFESQTSGCIHNRNASIPFGGGARSCPGRNLSMLEMKMAMAMVCKNFSVSRVEAGQPVQEIFSFTMMPDNLKVKFEKR